jgi:hypothetical protein
MLASSRLLAFPLWALEFCCLGQVHMTGIACDEFPPLRSEEGKGRGVR